MAQTSAGWTSVLSVLPARERLEWTKTINADVEAQAKAAPQGMYSRAYASLVHGAAGGRVAILERSAIGGHLTAVKHEYPSSERLVAQQLQEAIEKVGKKPDRPFTGGEALSLNPDDKIDAHLLASVSAAQLGAAYRPIVAKYLQRRLATDPVWAAEATAAPADGASPAQPSVRYPHAASLAKGEVASLVQHAWEGVLEERRAVIDSLRGEQQPDEGQGDASMSGASAATGSNGPQVTHLPPQQSPPAAAAVAGGGAAGDDLLDAALDELLG